MNVEIHLYSQANPVLIKHAHNAYTKDGLYCVMLLEPAVVYKFPVQHIFRIKEATE